MWSNVSGYELILWIRPRGGRQEKKVMYVDLKATYMFTSEVKILTSQLLLEMMEKMLQVYYKNLLAGDLKRILKDAKQIMNFDP